MKHKTTDFSNRSFYIQKGMSYVFENKERAIPIKQIHEECGFSHNQFHQVRREINTQNESGGCVRYLEPITRHIVVVEEHVANPEVLLATEAALLNLPVPAEQHVIIKEKLKNSIEQIMNSIPLKRVSNA